MGALTAVVRLVCLLALVGAVVGGTWFVQTKLPALLGKSRWGLWVLTWSVAKLVLT